MQTYFCVYKPCADDRSALDPVNMFANNNQYLLCQYIC